MNPVIDCLMNHRSVRKFDGRPVEPESIDLILKAGTPVYWLSRDPLHAGFDTA